MIKQLLTKDGAAGAAPVKPMRRHTDKPRAEPPPGWRGEPSGDTTPLVNPRPPAVPASLLNNLEQYYTACAMMGMLGSQKSEPNKEWVAKWACDMGEIQAAEVRQRGWKG